MKIRVNKFSDGLYWYATKLGIEFEVSYVTKENSKKMYWVRTGDAYNTLNFVLAEDAEVIEDIVIT